jgi:hypothetical protein
MLESIKGLAGCKAKGYQRQTTIAATGAWSYTFATIPLDQLFLVTHYTLAFTSGTMTGLVLQVSDDTGQAETYFWHLTPAVSTVYMGDPLVMCAGGQPVVVSTNVTAQPCTVNFSVMGFLFKGGEGALD